MGHHRRQLGATLHDKGVDFAVWAPFAKSVSLLLLLDFDWEEHPLIKDEDGTWTIEDVDAKAGRSYKYKIVTPDGRELERNDPYARQLTDSDNGASIITVRDFEWEQASTFTPVPKELAVIYELHVGTFNRPDASTPGTFLTAIEKLDYLKDLGVTHIELMPITSMASSQGWGYAPNYIFSVENTYGGRRGLLDFVKACHEKGIGIILDVVYNHFGPGTDLWQFDGWSENGRGGIYFYNDERGDTPWGGRPDYGRPEVRQFILDNITMWLTEFKIDGLRVDSTIYMRNSKGSSSEPDADIPDAWSLLADITTLAKKINPRALMIAEDTSSNAQLVSPVNDGGAGFDAQWELGFPHVIRDSLNITQNPSQGRLDGIVWELNHSYTGNAFDKVIFSDSHDTTSNGSVRLNEAVSPGNAESVSARHYALLANAVALTAPGIPMLLQGQEFMQEGAFHDWQMLEWNKTEQFSGIVLAHKHLISLRHNSYDNTRGLLGSGINVFHRDNDNNVIGYHRWDKGGPKDDTLIIVNSGGARFKKYDITLPIGGDWRVRFNSSWKGYSSDFHETKVEVVRASDDGNAELVIADYGVLILSKD
ncbi:1,4-alpha-glucan branching protein [Candidatus Saccharibacteria bacterium]|nr:1,4-alpha-glucan branching protein [Candidatus Saccharibacteria bacterium]NCS82922.1 1,4-alpha-glucan branching protein [Candidatus Saccharibacteria bacterium]